MASWNLPIQINRLVQEITDIGEYVGYFWNLIPSDSGIVISGSSPSFSVVSPNANNTSYAYSNLKRNEPWALSCIVGENTFFVLGISTDLTANFPNPSAPSMKMINYGLAFDTQNGNGIYQVVDGVWSGTPENCDIGSKVSITYDGTTLKYFVNDVQIFSSITATIDPVNLVVSSYYGGSVSDISFTGSGGSSGGSQNLQETLQNGNNAGNLNISNVNLLTVNDIAASQNITASSFAVSLGPQQNGVVFDSLVHLPNVLINSNLVNINSKIYPCNTSTSILQFHTEDYNEILNNFTLFFKTLSFQFNVINGSNATQIYTQFFLSDTLNGDFDNTNPLNISWTSPNLNVPTGGDPLVNTAKIMLALQSEISPLVDGIYLNIKTLSSDLTNTFQLQDFSFNTQLNASFLSNKSQNPDIL